MDLVIRATVVFFFVFICAGRRAGRKPALQLLDGFTNTADHARGLLPRYVADAGFTDVERVDRLRTIAGSFEM